MRANNRANNERNPKSCSKVIARTRSCGRRRRLRRLRRRRTDRYKNIKSPPVYRGDLIIGHLWGTLAVTTGSPSQRPVMLSFDVPFVVYMNMLVNIQLSCRWFQTPWRSCGVSVMFMTVFTKVRELTQGMTHCPPLTGMPMCLVLVDLIHYCEKSAFTVLRQL